MVGKRSLHSGASVIFALERVGASVREAPVENRHYLTAGVDRSNISEIAYRIIGRRNIAGIDIESDTNVALAVYTYTAGVLTENGEIATKSAESSAHRHKPSCSSEVIS